MAPYSTTAFLLDRAHIHDTVTKLYLLTDLRQWDRLLASEVFAATFTLDYTAMFGGEPTQRSPADVVGMWRPLMEGLTSTQHVQTSLLIEGLPAALGSADRDGDGDNNVPDAQAVTHAKVTSYVTVHITKKGAPGGDSTSNGGINSLELVRLSTSECRAAYGQEWDGNPWRISAMKAAPSWYEGNTAILGVKHDGAE